MRDRKSSQKATTPANQLSILDYIRETEAARKAGDPAPGSMHMEAELKAALTADIRHARDKHGRELSRADISARLTDLLGEEVTLSTINNFTAPSHSHRFPLSWLAAWCEATGSRHVLEIIARRLGIFIMPGPDALRAEIDKYVEVKRGIDKKIRERRALLDGMGGGHEG